MSFALAVEPLPLRTDSHGTIRVGPTRVPLDTVVEAFLEGLTAEEIAQQYPVLDLADVYAVISYYLKHRPAIESYLQGRRQQADELRARLEARSPQAGLRALLLARRADRPRPDDCA
jgi:uncharacterized protein (DUF433 family)